MDRVPITVIGNKRLNEELKNLKSVERPQVIAAIAEARAHGDLSENAEYHAARERQSFIEGRIEELEDKLGRAEVIDPSQFSDEIIKFGAHVTLCENDDQTHIYQIVGELESNVEEGRISISSPLARALISKTTGEIVEVQTPAGKREYEIVEVEYRSH
ncbi:MAG: transcription elongation factor GreA [Pseudomonadota bacterium]